MSWRRVESPWSPGRPGASAPPPCAAWPPPGGRWWRWTGPPTTPASPTRSARAAELDDVVVTGPPTVGPGRARVGGRPCGRHHRRRRPRPPRSPWPRTASAASTPWWPWPGSSPAGPPVGDAGRPARRRPRASTSAARSPRPGSACPPCSAVPDPAQGRFLAVASAAATTGLPMLAAYGAAKAGVAGLVRGLAAELAGTGITANAVCPGSTDTAMLAESARLYDLAGHRPVRRPAGGRPAAGSRTRWPPPWSGWPGRPSSAAHRGGHPGRRRPQPVTSG